MARRKSPPPEPVRRVRCAIYTRKSHAEGLEQAFNSLDAQRESAENYIASQRHEGWVALETRYDDGACSGATLERPALERLLRDVEGGRVDAIVLYKLDRLSRSLLDFLRIVELLDEHDVALVSVTQSFDTKTSMGRLTLNILLSFAQFEREIIGERIRDKLAAARRRGRYTGGPPILGYDVDREAKRLVVNPKEARLVRRIFRRFSQIRSATTLARELNRQGHRTKSWTTRKGVTRDGRPWNKAHIHRLLNNRTYLGEVEHKGQVYPGEHQAIVPRGSWNEAHQVLEENSTVRSNRSRSRTPALLRGIIRCGHCGCAMGPTFTGKEGRRYRYYLCVHASRAGYAECPVRSVPAGDIEAAVVDQLRAVFRAPELIVKTFREARARETEEIERLRDEEAGFEARLRELADACGDVGGGQRDLEELAEVREQLARARDDRRLLETHSVTEREIRDALHRLHPIWEELFPAEQERIVGLLLERVDVHPDGLEIRLRCDGLRSLVTELGAGEEVTS